MTMLFRKVTFSVIFHLKTNNYTLLFLCLFSIGHAFAQNPADLCSSAVTLTPTLTLSTSSYTLPGSYVYDGLSASCMSGTNQDDGWYTFTAQTTHYTFELTGDYIHTAGIYSGACGGLTEVACGNAAAGGTTSVAFTTVPGSVYYVQVQRNSGTAGQDMNGTMALYYSAAPGGVSNTLKAWYKADGNLVKSGTTVTGWNTEYGNANFTNVFNAPQYSSNTANFNPAVVFGGNDYINNSNVLGSDLLSTSDNTVFIVSKLTAGTSGVLVKWEESFPNDRFGFEGAPYPVATEMRMDHPTTTNQKLGGVIGDWNICTGATNATTDNLYQNGLVVGTNSGGTNNVGLPGTLTVGGDNFSGYHSNSSISEIIFFGTALSAFEQQKVQSYLAVKYGITLGTNASPLDYYSSNGTKTWAQNTSSQNDIAGIARDDKAGLSQLKSKSANTDDIVTMALVDAGGSFATPNPFSADNSAMLWGNDNGIQPPTVVNGGLVESTVECPSSILRRLSRQWLIYETGTVGNVALTMDLTSIPVTATTFYDMRLLIDLDGDGDFTTGTVKRITPSSYSGGIVTFNSVDFINGQVFTLATLTSAPGGVSTGLEIWLKASSLTSTTTNNAQLDNWYNAGSSNFDFNRITGSSAGWPRYRSNAINFNPTIWFGASGAMISLNDPTNMRPTINNSTSMVVFKTIQSAGTSNFWASPNFITTETYYTGRDYGFGMTGGKLGLKIENGEPWDVNSSGSVNDNVTHLAMAMRSRGATVTTPSAVTMQVDGKTDVTATSAGDSYPLDAADATGISYMGTGIGGTSISGTDVYSGVQYNGYLPEVLVFNNSLSAVNLNKVNSYLAIKYGITLGNNSAPVSYTNSQNAVVWTGSSVYQHNIAAIGRDDRSELDQRRSVSIETDNMTDMALVDNGGTQASPNAFDSDRDFFIIGNDNGAKMFSGADVDGVIILNRLVRVWKTQETGTVGNVLLAVNLTAVPTAITGSDLRLLVDRDNDGFADNDVAPQAPDSYNAATKTVYFTANLVNGDLFTVGTALNPLPVEFIGISVVAASDHNVLSWQTATEVNNHYFVVQRLVQGTAWDSIGTVQAANNSNTLRNYTFSDYNIAELPFAYYRVVQYDNDGASMASKIVYVEHNLSNNSNLIRIGPNPADRYVDIAVNEELFHTSPYAVSITSVLGVEVYHATLSEANSRIDLSNLSSGNYILEVMNASGAAPVYDKIIVRHQ